MAAKQIGGGIVIFDVNTGGTGGAQNTANGLSGDGSVATPIILGGSPLTQNVILSGTGVSFEIFVDNGAGIQSEFVLSPGANTISAADTTPATALLDLVANSFNSYFSLLFQNDGPGTQRQVIGSKNDLRLTTGKGVGVKDTIDNIGLIGDVLFPRDDDNQYVQFGNLGSQIVGKVNTALQSGLNTNFTIYTVNATKNQLLRINPGLFVTSAGATTSLSYSLSYTDQAGTVRSVTLVSFLPPAATDAPTIPAQVIYALKNTNVVLNVTLNIAGGQYQVYATCEYLGIQN